MSKLDDLARAVASGQARPVVYVTHAPFEIGGRWKWHTWRHHEPEKHAAMIAKGKALGADAWDYGQADHDELSRSRYAR
jgi:hypothetical protein